jgi:uncharacterized membrane protein
MQTFAATTLPPDLATSITFPQSLMVRRTIWAIAVILVCVFFAHAAARFGVFTEASYGRLWVNRLWLLPHFIGGSIALLFGVLQFWAWLRKNHPRVHRWVGRTYLVGVAIGAGSAYALSFRAVLGWPFGVAAFVMASAWVSATVLAYIAIRNGQVKMHREWMLRSYVITFAFVTFRVMLVSPLFAGLGSLPERLTVLLWLSWTVPLIITEIVLQWRSAFGAVEPARRALA